MRIAVAYEDGQIFQHFGHTKFFKLYNSNGSHIEKTALLGTEGSGHGALANLLASQNVDVLICGGMGEGAKEKLAKANIVVYGGITGNADNAVANFLAGKLPHNTHALCGHPHSHGDEKNGGHHCGGHCQGHTL